MLTPILLPDGRVVDPVPARRRRPRSAATRPGAIWPGARRARGRGLYVPPRRPIWTPGARRTRPGFRHKPTCPRRRREMLMMAAGDGLLDYDGDSVLDDYGNELLSDYDPCDCCEETGCGLDPDCWYTNPDVTPPRSPDCICCPKYLQFALTSWTYPGCIPCTIYGPTYEPEGFSALVAVGSPTGSVVVSNYGCGNATGTYTVPSASWHWGIASAGADSGFDPCEFCDACLDPYCDDPDPDTGVSPPSIDCGLDAVTIELALPWPGNRVLMYAWVGGSGDPVVLAWGLCDFNCNWEFQVTGAYPSPDTICDFERTVYEDILPPVGFAFGSGTITCSPYCPASP